uniref:Uncharacterized protein n=1 Tax=Acrobeloides nanus TaxID=290746 RepID=A0A914DI94_9BILA
MDAKFNAAVLALILTFVLQINFVQAITCYSCSDFKSGGGMPNCTGTSIKNYNKVQCQFGYCYYGRNTLFFNDTYLNISESKPYIERGCYKNDNITFPYGWPTLGINQTWDCLVTDYYVLSFNKDADHEYDCTCNSNLCNGVQELPTFFPPTTAPPPITCYRCSDFKPGQGVPKCTGVNTTSYGKIQCPLGYCYYGQNTIYFNDTILGTSENTPYVERDCYQMDTFPDGWFSLGINQTWDCLVTDYNVLSFNKDADHDLPAIKIQLY